MNTKVIRFSLFLVMATSIACVSPQKYHDLENDDNATREKLADAEARISELESKLGIASTEKTTLNQEKRALAESNDEMKNALSEMEKRKQETERRLADFRELMQKFSKLVDAGKLKIKFINGKMVVALSTDILFPSGSAALSPQGESAIKEVTKVLASLKDKKFQIEGHTDDVPILRKKQFASNWELASARSMTVLKTMLDTGMPEEKISAASYGDTQPLADNKTSEGRSSNRRIAIVIVPDLSGMPGFDELSKMASDK